MIACHGAKFALAVVTFTYAMDINASTAVADFAKKNSIWITLFRAMWAVKPVGKIL
jgi:hypothetical protein